MKFTSFLPAISKDALKKISAEIRSWRLHRGVDSDGSEIARLINPKVRGWMGYYGAFYRVGAVSRAPPRQHLPDAVVMNKYRTGAPGRKPPDTGGSGRRRRPRYFAHWAWVKPAAR